MLFLEHGAQTDSLSTILQQSRVSLGPPPTLGRCDSQRPRFRSSARGPPVTCPGFWLAPPFPRHGRPCLSVGTAVY